jgi:hypothetical protein
MPVESYKIVRFFQKHPRRTVKRGLTLAEAQAHCQDPETSSVTCKKPENKRRTKKFGPWFDGYEME